MTVFYNETKTKANGLNPDKTKNPRILIVTPEVTYLPKCMGNLRAKAGGLADVSAALINALYSQGADIHVALPDYRTIFSSNPPILRQKLDLIRKQMPDERIHLAKDMAFFYRNEVYSGFSLQNIKTSLAFQREVIHHIIPEVQPDLIHCNDWMTGLIPAVARYLNIPCLFSIHNIHTVHSLLSEIEDRGIDGASIWQHFYYRSYPGNYEETRIANPVDFLTTGVFSAHFVNTVSPTFLEEVVQGKHQVIFEALKQELADKKRNNCAVGILNSPDPSYNPAGDDALSVKYSPASHSCGKKANKLYLQKQLGLSRNDQAPVFFWPSRLDPVQKGCQLLSDILYKKISQYWEKNLQIVFIADGPFQRYFKEIVALHDLYDRVAVFDFNENLSRLAYGAADFILMPSSFEPCGLPQMIGSIYGALPIGHDTGGIHDTVMPLSIENNTGNGFLFEIFDQQGLSWAMDQAMSFYMLPNHIKSKHIHRIMTDSAKAFHHDNTAKQYMDLYERMLQRPLIERDLGKQNLAA